MAADLAAALILIAHDNKAGVDVAGSHVIRAMAKVILRVTLPRGEGIDEDGHPNTSRRLLTVESKLIPATSAIVELHGVGTWTWHGTAAEVRERGLEDEILSVVREHDDPPTEIQIHEAVKGRRDRKLEAVRRLLEAKRLARVGAGKRGDPYRYVLPEANAANRLQAAQGERTEETTTSPPPSPLPPEGISFSPPVLPSGTASSVSCTATGPYREWERDKKGVTPQEIRPSSCTGASGQEPPRYENPTEALLAAIERDVLATLRLRQAVGQGPIDWQEMARELGYGTDRAAVWVVLRQLARAGQIAIDGRGGGLDAHENLTVCASIE